MKFNLSTAKNLIDLITKLSIGLGKITFEDNTESFKAENVSIKNGKTVTIRNELTFITSKYIIVNQEGHGLVTKGRLADTNDANTFRRELDWDINTVYLKNHGPNDVTVTVIFMR